MTWTYSGGRLLLRAHDHQRDGGGGTYVWFRTARLGEQRHVGGLHHLYAHVVRHFDPPAHVRRPEYLEGQDGVAVLLRELHDDLVRAGVLCGRGAQRGGQRVGGQIDRDFVIGVGEDAVIGEQRIDTNLTGSDSH